MRGPQTQCILQEPTESRTSAGGVTNEWHNVATFDGYLIQLSATELEAYGRSADVSLYRLRIDKRALPERNYMKLKNKHKIKCRNVENPLTEEEFEIIGVNVLRRGRNRISGWTVTLQKVE